MNGLVNFLRSMLPDDVACAAGTLDEVRADLFDIERNAISRAVAKRRREFRAGRSYARAALAVLGCPPQPIPVGADRRPIWPNGFIGSISHCDQVCAAVAARSEAYAGVGIDIEGDEPVDDGMRALICRPEERQRAAAVTLSTDGAKLLFVVKEAVFKAYYPATGAFLDFHDVSVDLDERSQAFAATIVGGDKPTLANSRCFLGRISRIEGHLVAAVAIAWDMKYASRPVAS
jgi:4'-phosphopantetheinyl transferase EntD